MGTVSYGACFAKLGRFLAAGSGGRSSADPPRQRDGMETSQVPVPYVRAWVLRHRGIPTPLAIAASRILPSAGEDNLGIPDDFSFGAQ